MREAISLRERYGLIFNYEYLLVCYLLCQWAELRNFVQVSVRRKTFIKQIVQLLPTGQSENQISMYSSFIL